MQKAVEESPLSLQAFAAVRSAAAENMNGKCVCSSIQTWPFFSNKRELSQILS